MSPSSTRSTVRVATPDSERDACIEFIVTLLVACASFSAHQLGGGSRNSSQRGHAKVNQESLGGARENLAALFVIVLSGLALFGCGGSGGQSSAPTSSDAAKETADGWRSIPASGAGSGEFSSVACLDAEDCWATANIEEGGSNGGQIFHFDGGAWERVATPGKALTLYGIACPTKTSCWAVGAAASDQETISTLIEHFDGKTWTVEESPNVAGFPESGLSGIACPSATECWAAGDGEDFSQEPTAGELLLLHYNEGAWSTVSAPSPQEEEQTGDGALLACGSVSQCVLLTNFGSEEGRNNEQAGDVFDGNSWQPLSVPPGILFQAATCPAEDDCIGIGGPRFDGPMSAYRFDGKGWSQPEPLPAKAGAEPVSWYAVTCLGRSECWAAGGQPIAGATFPAVVAHFQRGAWELPPQPEEPGELTGISCSSAASCMAVGGASLSQTDASAMPLALALGLSP